MRSFVHLVLWMGISILPLHHYSQSFPVLKWQKFYDFGAEEIPKKIIASIEGDLWIGGNSYQSAAGPVQDADIWILKVDTLGRHIFEQSIQMDGSEELHDMIATKDGGIIFAGVTSSMVNPNEQGNEAYWGDFFVGKLNAYGEIAWLKNFGGSRLDQARSLANGMFGEVVIAGITHSYDGQVNTSKGMGDVWTVLMDQSGTLLESKVIGGKRNDWVNAVYPCTNGDFLMAGFTNSPNIDGQKTGLYGNGLLVRINAYGKIKWQRSYPCPHGGFFTDVQETPKGNILLIGQYGLASHDRKFWWIKMSPTGDIIHQKTMEGPHDGQLTSIEPTKDSGYILGGYAYTNPKLEENDPYQKGAEDFWLIRTDADGNVIWKNTYGGPGNERCRDVLSYSKGIYFAIGEKKNEFTRDHNGTKDFWLLRIEERPCDSIQPDIFVRAEKMRIPSQQPIRFRALSSYGDQFLWDFDDGTHSYESDPLKMFTYPGKYQVKLTVFANESCQQTVFISKHLEVR